MRLGAAACVQDSACGIYQVLLNKRGLTLAVFSGSAGSSGGGARLVLTAQKRQPRVHVSPISMIVAVAVCPSPPPQHSLRMRTTLACKTFRCCLAQRITCNAHMQAVHSQ